MAERIEDNQESGYSSNKGKKKSEAFGNIVVNPKNSEKGLQVPNLFLPMDSSNGKLHRSIINAAKANGGEITIDAKFIVRLAAEDDGTDYEL